MIEIRKDSKGREDDIVVDNVEMFRMERMTEAGAWWLRIYGKDGKKLTIRLEAPLQPFFEIEED